MLASVLLKKKRTHKSPPTRITAVNYPFVTIQVGIELISKIESTCPPCPRQLMYRNQIDVGTTKSHVDQVEVVGILMGTCLLKFDDD